MKPKRKQSVLSGKFALSVLAVLCLTLSFTAALQADLFLWEIENGGNKVYLLGSIHTMPKDIYPLDEKIEKAFEGSDILVVEVDATKIDQTAINNFIAYNAVYRDTVNLQTVLDEDLFKEVSTRFSELGFNEDQLKMFKPWFVSLNLGMGALQKIDIETAQGIDMHFLNKANEKQMPIMELETAETQLEALSSMDEQTQIDFLNNSIQDYDNINENFNNMLAAWKAGDAEKINELTRQKLIDMEMELPGIKHYYNKLFRDRDVEITDKLESYLENEENHTYFVIVGAFHFVGEEGILKLLQDKGYKTIQQKESNNEKN